MPDCQICCEKLNKSNHTPVVCEYTDCNFKTCKECVRKYLLGTVADPHCMNCKKVWTDEFLVTNLNKSFYTNDYRIHRKQLLVDREISKLPETIALAEQQSIVNEEQEKINL